MTGPVRVLIESGVTRPHDPYTFTMVFETGLCRRNHGGLDLHWDRSVIFRQATNATLLPTSFNSVTRKTISKSGNGLAGGSPNMLRAVETESSCNRNCPAISFADIENHTTSMQRAIRAVLHS